MIASFAGRGLTQNRIVGYALTFNGATKHVTFGDIFAKERTNAFSISLWIKGTPASVAISKCLTSNLGGTGRGYKISPQADGSVYASMANNEQLGGSHQNAEVQTTSTGLLTATTWTHVVLTNSGGGNASGMRIYTRGTSRTLTTISTDLAATIVSNAPLIWGAMSSALQFPFTGKSTQLSLYNKELSAGEVTTIGGDGNSFPDLTSVGPTSDLYSYWPVTSADTASVIQDATANNRDGTPTNMSSTDIVPVYHHELRAT